MDLRERHLDYWTPYSDVRPQERNGKRSNYHQWCTLPNRRALVTHAPYTLPRIMFLDLPRDVFHSMARFRLRAHPLQIKTVTWTHNTSPTCDLCNVTDVQEEQHILFHNTHPHVVSEVSLLPLASTKCLLFWARKTISRISSIMH